MQKVIAFVCVFLCCLLLGSNVTAEQTDVYFSPVVSLAPGEFQVGAWNGIPKPGEDVIIVGLSYQIYSALTNETVPIEDVYLHHLFFIEFYPSSNNYSLIAGGSGVAEHKPFSMPSGYGIYLKADSLLILEYEFVNTWGVAAMANYSVYVGYNITWVPVSQKLKTLDWILIDVTGFPVGNFTYNVPDSCPQTNGVYTRQISFTWPNVTSEIAIVAGHMHVGGISVTLCDSKGNVICKSVASYNNYGYIETISPCYVLPNTLLVQGQTYTLSVAYACNGYGDVMGLGAIYYSPGSTL